MAVETADGRIGRDDAFKSEYVITCLYKVLKDSFIKEFCNRYDTEDINMERWLERVYMSFVDYDGVYPHSMK